MIEKNPPLRSSNNRKPSTSFFRKTNQEPFFASRYKNEELTSITEHAQRKNIPYPTLTDTILQRSPFFRKSKVLIQRDAKETQKGNDQLNFDVPVIKGSVGKKGKNDKNDVYVVQKLLRDSGFDAVNISGIMDGVTLDAILAFQKKTFSRRRRHNGKVRPNKHTWKALTKTYYNPDPIKRERKQFAKKKSIMISPLDISGTAKRRLAFVRDRNKDNLDDVIEVFRQATKMAPGVDKILAKDIRHTASILQKYYDKGISIDTLYIISHGSYSTNTFLVGNELINYKAIPRLQILKNLVSPNTKLVIFACHTGGGRRPKKGRRFTAKLAQTLGITVYTNRSWGPLVKTGTNVFKGHAAGLNRPSSFKRRDMRKRRNVYKLLGEMLEAVPGSRRAKVRVVNSLKLNPDGTFEKAKTRFPTWTDEERQVYKRIIKKFYRKKR